MNIQDSILEWTKEVLSQKQSFLANLPPCPYAAEAIFKSEVMIYESSPTDIFDTTLNTLKKFKTQSKKIHIIATAEWKTLSVDEVQKFVHQCREMFYKQDLWLLYDHPAATEVVQDFCFNHGELLLFMVQRLSDLVTTSNELARAGYYKNWSPEYFQEVVQMRQAYYQKYLEQDVAHEVSQ